MKVCSLRLFNFRNYALQDLELPGGLVALTGDNGQGKTNFLEAVCVLAATKSPLVERDKELIRWEQREARITAEIESGPRAERRVLEYGWRVEGTGLVREMRAGGVPQSAVAQWLGQLQTVAFFPHDLCLVTGEPGERRRFLNLELGKTRPAHFADAVKYRRVLQQRNALLKSIADSRYGRRVTPPALIDNEPGTLAEWNRQIITYGARILSQRAQFLQELAPLAQQAHRELAGHETPLEIAYAPGLAIASREWEASRAETESAAWTRWLGQALERDHDTDTRRGTTQSGPHRDDITFKLGGAELRRYGSQGQQRLAVLALKIALARWIVQTSGESPILLLDDALSELDATRRANLLTAAQEFAQTVITATDARFLQGVAATVFHVEAGRVEKSVE